jgi:hypothetical protein
VIYSIDLETMVQILQEHRQTGVLQAELPGGMAGLRERCRIEIDVVKGNIVACRVENSSEHVVLWGDDALREVHRLGVLDWTLTLRREPLPPLHASSAGLRTQPLSSWERMSMTDPFIRTPSGRLSPGGSTTGSTPVVRPVTGSFPVAGTSLIPRRTKEVEPGQMQAWHRTQRMVYALIDGKNSVQRITSMLSLSPRVVEQVLRALQAMGVIVLE